MLINDSIKIINNSNNNNIISSTLGNLLYILRDSLIAFVSLSKAENIRYASFFFFLSIYICIFIL